MTNAQKSAAQATPSSVGYNGLMELTKMMIAMKATVTTQMTMIQALTNLCGEKQLQASLKASAPHQNVRNVVWVGTKAILVLQNTAAKTIKSTSTPISVARRLWKKRVRTYVWQAPTNSATCHSLLTTKRTLKPADPSLKTTSREIGSTKRKNKRVWIMVCADTAARRMEALAICHGLWVRRTKRTPNQWPVASFRRSDFWLN